MKKKDFYFPFKFFAIFLCLVSINVSAQKITLSNWCNSNLSGDFGFLNYLQTTQLLQLTHSSDTLLFPKNKIFFQDTTGKYFLMQDIDSQKRYIFCVADYSFGFATHILFDIALIDSTWIINQQIRYVHGNYPCCWDNAMSGFGKLGSLFYIDICGTGSAYCSGYRKLIYIEYGFETIGPLPLSLFQGAIGTGRDIYYFGNFTNIGNIITGKYTMKIAKRFSYEAEEEENENIKYKEYNFEIKYRVEYDKIKVLNRRTFRKYFKKSGNIGLEDYLN